METDDSINAELSNQKNKDILLQKIAILKTYVCLLESTGTETPKLRQAQLAEIQSKLLHNSEATFHDVSDVQSYQNWNTELFCDISQFTEMPCIKIEQNSKFVFEVSNAKDIAKKDIYAIEILIDDNGHGKLGKCILPNFINVQNILSQYPIDDLNNMKHFLKSCKHHIDSYFSRLNQVEELKKLFLDVENAYISYNSDISLIELTILGVRDMNITKFYDVPLYLYYNLDEARPYKLSSSTDGFEISSPALIRRLNKYFEPFLKMDLSSALLQISEVQTEFVWKKDIEEDNEDDIEIYEYEIDEENVEFMTQYLYQDDKAPNENEIQNDSTGNGNVETVLDENKMKILNNNKMEI